MDDSTTNTLVSSSATLMGLLLVFLSFLVPNALEKIKELKGIVPHIVTYPLPLVGWDFHIGSLILWAFILYFLVVFFGLALSVDYLKAKVNIKLLTFVKISLVIMFCSASFILVILVYNYS